MINDKEVVDEEVLEIINIRLLGKIGYTMEKLYDRRNDPRMLNKLLLLESMIEKYNMDKVEEADKKRKELMMKYGRR